MSCEDCEEAKEKGIPKSYYRVDNANIEIIACAEHIRETIIRLRKADGHEVDKPVHIIGG